MCVGDAQDAQDDAVRVSTSGRNFFFCDARVTCSTPLLNKSPFTHIYGWQEAPLYYHWNPLEKNALGVIPFRGYVSRLCS